MSRKLLSLVTLFTIMGTLAAVACISPTATPTRRPPTATRPAPTATATRPAPTATTPAATPTTAATPAPTATLAPGVTPPPATPTQAATATKPAPTATTPPAGGAPAIPANHAGRTTCAVCHSSGVAGAPKFPDSPSHTAFPDQLALCQGCHK